MTTTTVTSQVNGLAKSMIVEPTDLTGDERLDTASLEDESQEDDNGKGKKKQADILVELAMPRAEFFTGNDGQHYAIVKVGEHKECYRLSTMGFSDWLTSIYYTEYRSVPGSQAKADTRALFGYLASKSTQEVFVRSAHSNGKIYIDRCTPEWDAIEVDGNGMRIVDNPPVNFIRTRSMLPLPIPVECTDTYLLRKYINIEDEDWPLVAAWIIASMSPIGPKTILVLISQAGSGKSTQLRVVKRIIDPAVAELRGKIGEERDLYIAANNSWLLAFDNISYLSNDTSDALCRISTGGGFTKRQLHSDGEEYIIDVMRPMIVNGIGDIMQRQDLVDRSIIISTPVLPENKRIDEKEFWASFEKDRPAILGAFLNALSVGLRNLPSVKLTSLPRMADFAKLAVAAEPAYIQPGQNFLDTYNENRELASEVIVESSVLADVIKEFMQAQGAWSGSPKELFDKLENTASEQQRNDKSWPKSAARMKSPLERLAPALRGQNIDIQHKRSNGKRSWTIERIDK